MLAIFSIVAKLARRVNPVLAAGGGRGARDRADPYRLVPASTKFCARLVYFLAGWHLAGAIFRLADRATEKPLPALGFLCLWAVANGALALTPAPIAGVSTLAALPLVSLALGSAGAVAIVRRLGAARAHPRRRARGLCGTPFDRGLTSPSSSPWRSRARC